MSIIHHTHNPSLYKLKHYMTLNLYWFFFSFFYQSVREEWFALLSSNFFFYKTCRYFFFCVSTFIKKIQRILCSCRLIIFKKPVYSLLDALLHGCELEIWEIFPEFCIACSFLILAIWLWGVIYHFSFELKSINNHLSCLLDRHFCFFVNWIDENKLIFSRWYRA